MEIWKSIKNYETTYEVSNLGRVKSLPKLRRASEKILIPCKTKAGYLVVDLGDGKSIKRHLIHRLVAQAFLENSEEKPQVNHINGIKDDNSLSNLEWNTRSENQKHSIKAGLRTTKGEKNSQSVLTEKDVFIIRGLLETGTMLQREIALVFGVSNITISDIKRKRSWRHI